MKLGSEVVWRDDVVTPSMIEVVELAFVRDQHLRVSHTAEDDYISRLVRVAVVAAEHFTHRAIGVQTRRLTIDARFPCELWVGYPPVVRIDAVRYIDPDGQEQTLDEAAYDVDRPVVAPLCRRTRIVPAYGTTWPETRCQVGAVYVDYTAGYVTEGTSPMEPAIPEDLVHGMLLVVGELYKQRSLSVNPQATSSSPAQLQARGIWAPYVVY